MYEVSDAPRYCGTGHWQHAGGISTWTSDLGWRPLPRREYTVRGDYNALEMQNRHTITPAGWTHEQFNTKVLRGADGSRKDIAREFGFNDYRKDESIDFTPAYDYWKATAAFWARVRARWHQTLSAPPGVHLKTRIGCMAPIIPLFTQAEELQAGKPVTDARIDAVFTEWVEPAPAAAPATAAR